MKDSLVSSSQPSPLKMTSLFLSTSKIRSFAQVKSRVAVQEVQKFKRYKVETLIHPQNYFLLIWHSYLLFCLILQGFYIPFIICFDWKFDENIISLDFMITLSFLLDILVTLNTAYISKGSIIIGRLRIFKHYLKHWLFLDIFTSFPYNWLSPGIFEKYSQHPQNLWEDFLFKLQWIKLLRLFKLKRMTLKIEDHTNNECISRTLIAVRVLAVIFYLAHWNACIWYFTGAQSGPYHPDSWITNVLVNSELQFGHYEIYITSLYWSFTTMLTVGYGDISANSNCEKILAMFSMSLASAFFGYVIGNITTNFIEKSAEEQLFREIGKGVDQFMKRNKIPPELKERVRSYLTFIQQQNQQNTVIDASVLVNLSLPLKDEISVFTNKPIFLTCPIIQECFSDSVITRLCSVAQESSYAPQDIIFPQNQTSRRLYFVVEGNVELFMTNYHKILKIVKPGDYFGEIAFFLGYTRCCGAKAKNFMTLVYLDFWNTIEALSSFPQGIYSFEQIRLMCQKDLQFFGIECFLCQQFGHVMKFCPRLEFFNHLLVPKAKDKKNIKAVKMSEKAIKNRNKAFNILGQTERSQQRMFRENPGLIGKIPQYEKIEKKPDFIGNWMGRIEIDEEVDRGLTFEESVTLKTPPPF